MAATDAPVSLGHTHCIYNHREIAMQTKVQKWGNSIALRIPKAFTEETRIVPNTAVELTPLSYNGQLIFASQAAQRSPGTAATNRPCLTSLAGNRGLA